MENNRVTIYDVVEYSHGRFICELHPYNDINMKDGESIYVANDASINISDNDGFKFSKFYVFAGEGDGLESILFIKINGIGTVVLSESSGIRFGHILSDKYNLELVPYNNKNDVYKIDIVSIKGAYDEVSVCVDIITGFKAKAGFPLIQASNVEVIRYRDCTDISGLTMVTNRSDFFEYTSSYIKSTAGGVELRGVNAILEYEGIGALIDFIDSMCRISINTSEDKVDYNDCDEDDKEIVIYRIHNIADYISISKLSNVNDIDLSVEKADMVYFGDGNNISCATKIESFDNLMDMVDILDGPYTLYQYTFDKEIIEKLGDTIGFHKGEKL